MTPNETNAQDPSILDIAAVAATCTISKATIYRLMKAGHFPVAMPLVPGGRRVGWRAAEVKAWAADPQAWADHRSAAV
jgi:predicted DNA-binding transcriptional regulator AlpA